MSMYQTATALQGHYEIVDQIGNGAYSVVWKAKHVASGKLVAIKEVHNLLDKEILKRLLREIRLLKHFKDHDHIVALLEVFTDQTKDNFDQLFVVCELMDMDLHKLIQSTTPLTNDHIKLFTYQLLAGLKSMHSASVLHRDLKPKNILVNADGELKARVAHHPIGSEIAVGRNFLKMTMLSEVATLFYRAPDGILNVRPSRSNTDVPRKKADTPIPSSTAAVSDQPVPRRNSQGAVEPALRTSGGSPQPGNADANKASYTTAVDLWACGCIMAELVLRKPIFPGRTNKDLLELIVNTVGSPSVALLNKIPDGMYKTVITELGHIQARINLDFFPSETDPQAIDLLTKLLALDPEDRITVEKALRHPYLSQLFDEEELEQHVDTFTYPEDESESKTVSDYRELIWNEMTNIEPTR